eukprot:518992-Amphidinium_carterae.1
MLIPGFLHSRVFSFLKEVYNPKSEPTCARCAQSEEALSMSLGRELVRDILAKALAVVLACTIGFTSVTSAYAETDGAIEAEVCEAKMNFAVPRPPPSSTSKPPDSKPSVPNRRNIRVKIPISIYRLSKLFKLL